MKQDHLRIVSLNLRTARYPEQHNQAIREPRIAAYIADRQPDSLGVQECTRFWQERLDLCLTGFARAQEPHENPNGFKNFIYYNTATVRLVDSGIFWLSDTPDVASQCFGSRYFISCGWAVLERLDSGARYVHMNTHLDYTDEEIRQKEADILLPRAFGFADLSLPVLITGDFNTPPHSPTYEKMLAAGRLSDFRQKVAPPALPFTFNKYEKEEEEPDPAGFLIIDYCFCSDRVLPQAMDICDKFGGGYLSDHNALCFDMKIENI